MLKKCIHNSTYSEGRLYYTWDIFLNMLKPLVAFNGNHFIGYHKRPGVIVTIGVSDFQGKLKIRNYGYGSLTLIANDMTNLKCSIISKVRIFTCPEDSKSFSFFDMSSKLIADKESIITLASFLKDLPIVPWNYII